MRIFGTLKENAAAVTSPKRIAQVIADVRAPAVDPKVRAEFVEATFRTMIDAVIQGELKVQRSSF